MADVVTSIGQGTSHSESVVIDSVVGAGPYTVTLTAAVPASVVIGDAFWDEHATPRKYLITGVSGFDLDVVDSTGVGSQPDSSATSTAEVTRYYNGSTPMVDWESELDDTDLYNAADNAIGECYNDANFTSAVTIDGGGTIGLTSRTLTVAEGERHDGTAGVGARVVNTAAVASVSLGSGLITVVEWLEWDKGSQLTGSGFSFAGVGAADDNHARILRNVIYHNHVHNGLNGTVIDHNYDGPVVIENSLFYDIEHTFNSTCLSIRLTLIGSHACFVNNTLHDFTATSTGGSAGVTAIRYSASNDGRVQNNVITNVTTAGGGSVACFGTCNCTNLSHNASSDATATGTGSLTNIVTADQFLNITVGFEDLHLDEGSDCVGAGTDLGTALDGVQFDIDGFDRDTAGVVWDIGADQTEGNESSSSSSLSSSSSESSSLNSSSSSSQSSSSSSESSSLNSSSSSSQSSSSESSSSSLNSSSSSQSSSSSESSSSSLNSSSSSSQSSSSESSSSSLNSSSSSSQSSQSSSSQSSQSESSASSSSSQSSSSSLSSSSQSSSSFSSSSSVSSEQSSSSSSSEAQPKFPHSKSVEYVGAFSSSSDGIVGHPHSALISQPTG